MSPVEEPVIVELLPPPVTNGVTSSEGYEPVDRRLFQEGTCLHQAKRGLFKNKDFKNTTKKDRNAKGKKCIECVRKAEKDGVKIVEESHSICLTCGSRLCEFHAIAHSKASRSGDEHPFYYDQDDDRVRCFACEVIVDAPGIHHIKMVLDELKNLWKTKGNKDAKPGNSGDKIAATEEKPTVLDKPENGKPEKKPNQNGTIPPPADEGSKKANGFKKGSVVERIPGKNGYENGTGAGEKPKNGLSLPGSTAISAKGLSNLGNTCFFNSVMQCMMHTHQLAFYCDRFGRVARLSFVKPPKPVVVNDEKVEIEEATLMVRDAATPLNDALRAFLVEFRNGRTPSPSSLFHQISYKAARFRSMAQQDAHELLRYLLDGLCSEETARYKTAIGDLVGAPLTSKTKADPEIQRKAKAYLQVAGRPLLDAVFGGRLLQTIKCSKCEHVSVRYENLYDLSVPLTGGSHRSNGRMVPEKTQSSSTDSTSARPPSKHQLKKEKKARKNSRTLKAQISKTGEDEGTIETKMAELRVEGETGGASGEEEEAEEAKEETGKEKEKEREKGGRQEEAECSGGEENNSYKPEEKPVDPSDLTTVLTTMKTSLPSGQSIAASLLEFTAEERLEGTNAYECENCCTPKNKQKGATGAAKTRVEATKRYLIATPPVVLTIHVKRFQQMHMGQRVTTRKVSGHVHFPLIFDISPFCCKNVERIAPDQTSILYSLYGVVSHSGNLGGGHYVAYVKSRERIERTEEMLEAARAVCADVHAEPARVPSPAPSTQLRPEDAAKEVPGGQWYFCSDSRVSAISESKVLNEEAYLLFYERIY